MNAVCTIINEDYIPFAKALHSSLKRHTSGYSYFVLITSFNNKPENDLSPEINWLYLSDIIASSTAKGIIEKYLYQASKDEIRWALKPVLISYLLNKPVNKVIYADPDIFFVDNPSFLFDELDNKSIILFPHWQSIIPSDNGHLISLLKGGYFNAGFIGVSQSGVKAMSWWAEACHFKMEKSDESGLYDDQRYLDLIPWEFDNVKVIEHRGCNLACWNVDTNKRELIGGELLIAGRYRPVFIHFTHETIQHIVRGIDKLLFPYLEDYKKAFQDQGTSLERLLPKINFSSKRSFVVVLKHKLLIRTRIKRFLRKIAESV